MLTWMSFKIDQPLPVLIIIIIIIIIIFLYSAVSLLNQQRFTTMNDKGKTK